MSKHDQLDWDLEDNEPITALDNNGNSANAESFTSEGWKFYLKIKDLIPDWWAEFNGALNNSHNNFHNKVKYRNIESFGKKKFKHSQERQYFLWMIGPKRIWERDALSQKHSKRHVVPWLGDWNKRRLNGYWVTDNREQIKGLKAAILDNVESSQAIKATAPFIVQDLMRWVRLNEKIDKLFDGEPFSDDKPNSKSNLERVKLYMQLRSQVIDLRSEERR